jgi:hypothetical protein
VTLNAADMDYEEIQEYLKRIDEYKKQESVELEKRNRSMAKTR